MGSLLILYCLSILTSDIRMARYRRKRLLDLGNNGYKLDMDKIVDYYVELPDIYNPFIFLIPGYNIYISEKTIGEYNENKDYYMELLDNLKITKKMNDDEYTEYRASKGVYGFLSISNRTKEDIELLDNVKGFLFDLASDNKEFDKKKALSIRLGDEDNSHFDIIYDNQNDEFITLEEEGAFVGVSDKVKENFILHVTKLFIEIYQNFDKYKKEVNMTSDGIKLDVDNHDFYITFKNLYEYLPDEVIENEPIKEEKTKVKEKVK